MIRRRTWIGLLADRVERHAEYRRGGVVRPFNRQSRQRHWRVVPVTFNKSPAWTVPVTIETGTSDPLAEESDGLDAVFVAVVDRGTFSLASVWRDCYSAAMPDRQDGVNTSSTGGADDRALLRAVAAGDKEALRQLYTRHSAVLFALALKVLTDRAEAEDVLQEAFVQVWKTAGSFDDGRGKPLGWLIMLTRSRAIDRLRSRKTRTRVADSLAKDASQAGESTTPADEAQASEAQRTVRQALKSLPSDQRIPIELAYFGGLTQFEIAQQLSQPLGTVKTRMRNGMIRLREQLGGTGGKGGQSS
jgi:RNA polymerase sigma-70 factor, ECF subfamily